ncbi:MAG TPA: acetoacetate--CoA ligase [Ignavibacteriales bacterium]|nr:acetoacetate--CoA ligase [Ignavibacteriales bacterium]
MNENKFPIWFPSGERIKGSNLQQYLTFLKSHFSKDFNNYNELYNWSITQIEEFWRSIWEFSEIIHSKPYDTIISERTQPGAKWFTGSELNFAENLLKFRDDNIAIISIREKHSTVKLTYCQLYDLVARCVEGLRNLGVKKGDRVAGFLTNYPESVIAMLAATSLGAIWSSTSPDFGIEGVCDRFGQIEPKILFAIESYNYAGKKIDCREKIERIKNRIPSIEKIIVIKEYDELSEVQYQNTNSSYSANYIYFNDLLNNTSTEIMFMQLPFDHPTYIMYSSGTTGKPKCIVHGAGGTLLQHFKELHLHTDLKRDDKIAYYTTCGWMMWNWLVSSLMLGASIVLIDGSPAFPSNEILWQKIEEENVSIFGTSPKYLSGIEKSGLVPKEKFNLQSLRTILSTGSPLSEENFNWVYKNVKTDLQLSSISGGTDIISCFILGCPILPVYAGEIQCRGLGMKVEAYDDNGNSVIDEKGELVCTAPFPSRPIYFWNDPDGSKYHTAYFDFFPGIWRHGDYIKITSSGGVVVYGRSDATLNPGGVRIGTAEIYKVVESMEEISDSLVVGKNINDDVKIILFVVLRKDINLNNELIQKLKNKIRNETTPRHVPSQIIQIKEVPYTISGKKVEIAVTRILNGEKVDNKEALANPNSLDQFYDFLKYST